MSDPKAVLAEHGMAVPDGMTAKGPENNDNTAHRTMPMAPQGHSELSDVELSHAAGGAACGFEAGQDIESCVNPMVAG